MTESKNSNLIDSLSNSKKLLFVFANYATFFLLLSVLLVMLVLPEPFFIRVLISLAIIYLFPPVLGRLILLVFPIKNSTIKLDSTEFMAWWFLSSLQTIYSRFPFLEELLRSIPSAYSMWLRLWGSKIGAMTFWAPGVMILDRSFLNIADFVTFGAGVRLNPHVIVKNEDGERELVLANINIEKNSLIGGYSLLTAGTTICENECTTAFLRSPPFSVWKDNRRVKEPLS